MSARGRRAARGRTGARATGRALATTFVLATTCVLAADRAAAAPWSQVFAGERDTVVFVAEDGALLRAPFHLATRETLWTPPPGQHLVRLSASPAGGRVAWLARAFDHDTTRLWVSGPAGAELRMRYFALQPRRYGFERSESSVPSVEDHDARGGRLIRPSAFMRRPSSNTLAWTPDGRSLAFGYDGGVATLALAGGEGFGAGRLAPVSLEALFPSPLFLVDAIASPAPPDGSPPPVDQLDLERLFAMDTRKHGPGRADFLLVPTSGRWRVYRAPDLAASHLRAASPGTIWWVSDRTVRAIRVDDPEPTVELEAREPLVWIGYDASRRALLWAAGSRVGRLSEDGGAATVVFETEAPVRAVLASPRDHRVALVAGDSLWVWDPAGDGRERFHLGGLEPCAFFPGPDGRTLYGLDCGKGPPRLARADEGAARLVETATPRVKGGVLHALASGAWILLYAPGGKPPRTLRAYDVRAGAWTTVENPGVSGWEPLAPRD